MLIKGRNGVESLIIIYYAVNDKIVNYYGKFLSPSNMPEDNYTISNGILDVLYHYIHLVSMSSCLLELIMAQTSLWILIITNVVITISEKFSFFHMIYCSLKVQLSCLSKHECIKLISLILKILLINTFDNFSSFSFLIYIF